MEHADVVAAVREALANHPCRFELDEKTLDHLLGVLTDVGDGDLRRGIERVRHNHLWLAARIRRDEEYEANHGMMSAIRKIVGGVGEKIAAGVVWGAILVIALGILLFFGAKVVPGLAK